MLLTTLVIIFIVIILISPITNIGKRIIREFNIKHPARLVFSLIEIGGDFRVNEGHTLWGAPRFEITDTITGAQSYVYKMYRGIDRTSLAVVDGDLEWMNKFEASKLMDIVEKIIKDEENKEKRDMENRKKDMRERKRKIAINTYKDR